MNPISEVIVDAYDCEIDLSDVKAIEKAARKAVLSVKANIAEVVSYRFQPHGLTLCLILMESHFIVSTWPEHKTAIVNIFLCNPEMDAMACWESFKEALKPAHCVVHRVPHLLQMKKPKKLKRVA